MGAPVALLIAYALIWYPRLSNEKLYRTVKINILFADIFLLALLFATPASTAILLEWFVPAIFAAYFFNLRDMVLQLSILSLAAMAPLIGALQIANEGIEAKLVVFLPVLWLVAIGIFLQKKHQRQALADARDKTYADPLTGLANLRALHERADEWLVPDPNGGSNPVGLLLVDLDNFKSANTLYGHLGGDYALRLIAKQLKRVSSLNRIVARVGGDEFAVMIHGEQRLSESELIDVYSGAVRAARPEMNLEGVTIDASVGFAMYPRDGESIDDLLTAAVKSMYVAKARRAADHHEQSISHSEGSPRVALPAAAASLAHENELERLTWSTGGRSALGRNRFQRSRFAAHWRRLPAYSRFATAAWMIGSLTMLVSVFMPGANSANTMTVAVASLIGVATAFVCPYVLPPAGSPQHIIVDLFCLAVTGAALNLTGGVSGQAVPLVFLVIVYQSLFLGFSGLWFRLLGPVIVVASPLMYQDLGSGPEPLITIVSTIVAVSIAWMLTIAISYNQSIVDRARRKSERLAAVDPLTGLPNRRAFSSTVEAALRSDSGDYQQRLSLVMIDLDNFKSVNTELGHRAGDELLQTIAAALNKTARATDMVARVGGDEFAAVLVDVDQEQATLLADRLLAAVRAVTALDPATVHVSASAGIAVCPTHGITLDDLMRAADDALMAVKLDQKGRTRSIEVPAFAY